MADFTWRTHWLSTKPLGNPGTLEVQGLASPGVGRLDGQSLVQDVLDRVGEPWLSGLFLCLGSLGLPQAEFALPKQLQWSPRTKGEYYHG